MSSLTGQESGEAASQGAGSWTGSRPVAGRQRGHPQATGGQAVTRPVAAALVGQRDTPSQGLQESPPASLQPSRAWPHAAPRGRQRAGHHVSPSLKGRKHVDPHVAQRGHQLHRGRVTPGPLQARVTQQRRRTPVSAGGGTRSQTSKLLPALRRTEGSRVPGHTGVLRGEAHSRGTWVPGHSPADTSVLHTRADSPGHTDQARCVHPA